MDKRLQQIAENFDNMKIGLDDKFRFSCRQCGKCCIEREDILLTPLDLFKLSKKLNMTPNDFVEKYGEVYIGDSSRMVLVRLKPRGSIRRCPLLKDRKCSVHDAKPRVCAMFPIGRAFRLNPEKNSADQISVKNIEYIFNGAHCGNAEEHTVQEWLEAFGIPIEDEFFVEWQKTLTEICEIVHLAEKKFSLEKTLDIIWSAIYALMYMRYDIDQEFIPQFEKNRDELLEKLRIIPLFYSRGNKNA